MENVMKTKALIGSILMAAATLAIVPAARADSSEKELKAMFPSATFKMFKSESVNNIKLETYEVMVPKAPVSYATVTENGDLLETATPYTPADLPPDVTEVTTSLFGTPPTGIFRMTTTEYSVGVKTGKQSYAVKINAAGVVLGIDSAAEVAFEDPKQAPKADKSEITDLDKLVDRQFPGAKVTSLNKSLTSPGFFAAEFTQNGKYGWMVLNKENRVRSYSIQVPAGEVPKAVSAAIAEIKGAQVTGVSKYTFNAWQVTETLPGDTVEARIRPDGSVIQMESTLKQQMHASSPAKAKAK
jgi:hypothetical protein